MRENHSLYLGPSEQRQIALRQFHALLESATEAIAIGVRLHIGIDEHALEAAVAEGRTSPAVAVEELTDQGIVLRDLDSGLIDFPARLPDGREYLLCWVLGEPEVGFWHWPEAGFAGRRPLSDPPR